jgi:N-glycosylase/DNA lyase
MFQWNREKVANCMALYGLHKLEAFPADTWMHRITVGQDDGKFGIKRFPRYAGVAQQDMFFYQRSLNE